MQSINAFSSFFVFEFRLMFEPMPGIVNKKNRIPELIDISMFNQIVNETALAEVEE